MLGPERPEAVLPVRAQYLPTFSRLLIVNKLLSLSQALSLSLSHTHTKTPPSNAGLFCAACKEIDLIFKTAEHGGKVDSRNELSSCGRAPASPPDPAAILVPALFTVQLDTSGWI